MELGFWKYHALGNDYIVVAARDWLGRLSAGHIRVLCDRHYGLGADGVLVHDSPRDGPTACVRIFNPDGSEAEKSGNGLRIYARFLWDQQIVGDDAFGVETLGGRVVCQVEDRGAAVAVDMGQVRFESALIPVAGPPREVLQESMYLEDVQLTFSAATIGNPHCVILRDRVTATETRRWGPRIESDPRFPQRINVQFAEVLDRNNLKIEIWERGAGYTLASGSSSCAAAAVAKKLGLCDSPLTVHMPGGSLRIALDEQFRASMRGPVVHVASGVIAAEALPPVATRTNA